MKINRRRFLATSALVGGGVLIGYAATRPSRHRRANEQFAQNGEHFVTSWLKVDPNNEVTVYVPHSEMGQGVHTSLGMMAADEMDANWEFVNIEQAPAVDLFANGDIIIYDITQDPVVELGRIETGLSNEIMGLKVSPEGAIWFVCTNANELYQITITPILMGDLNGDGINNLMDVLLCIQFVMGISELEEDELNRADVNYDGVIDIFDVLLIVDLVLD